MGHCDSHLFQPLTPHPELSHQTGVQSELCVCFDSGVRERRARFHSICHFRACSTVPFSELWCKSQAQLSPDMIFSSHRHPMKCIFYYPIPETVFSTADSKEHNGQDQLSYTELLFFLG